MDRIVLRKTIAELLHKYRNVAIILIAGMIFMLIPTSQPKEEVIIPMENAESENLDTALRKILAEIEGAGKVEVLLTRLHGEKTIYQINESNSGDSLRRETVTITTASREETGLIQQIDPPVYLGALVVCEGAANANVRLSIVQAVMSLTGLTSDRITVLKMK